MEEKSITLSRESVIKKWAEMIEQNNGGEVEYSDDMMTMTHKLSVPSHSHSVSFKLEDEKTDIDRAIEELEGGFLMEAAVEERIRSFLKNDETLIDDLNHLIIAGNLAFIDSGRVEFEEIRAYEMGDKIIIEEKEDGDWVPTRTIGMNIALVLAYSRGKERVEEIEKLVEGIGEDSMDRLKELDDVKYPTDDRTYPKPKDSTEPIWIGDNVTWTLGSGITTTPDNTVTSRYYTSGTTSSKD